MSERGFKVLRVRDGRIYSVGSHPAENACQAGRVLEYFFHKPTRPVSGCGPLLAMTERYSCHNFYYDLQIANIYHKENRLYLPCVVRYKPSEEQAIWCRCGGELHELALEALRGLFPDCVLCSEIELVEELVFPRAREFEIVEAARRFFRYD